MASKWCVISDIDDTILNTSTSYLPKLSALVNTFFWHPKPIDNMPELYRLIQMHSPRPRFWYISASPYNIFPFFRSPPALKTYPNGNIVIPEWRDVVRIHLTRSTYHYKLQCMENLHQCYSSYKVILIGDTLMKDPEVYGEIYRKYPDWVLTILIRMTGDECLYRNSRIRFLEAFAMVPTHLYYPFRRPCELIAYLDNLI
jgi:phosphatidate phosphatase APP1